MTNPNHYRTIWLSDLHLGTRACKAEFLIDFLRFNEADHLYLVGDIFDGWALRRTWYWDDAHNTIIQKILRKARKGTRIVYIPGNHDEFARAFVGLHFGDIMVENEAIHTTVDGHQLLVLHGDAFDGVVKYAKRISRLGAWAYEVVLRLNHTYNRLRWRLGLPYWSLSAYLKHKTKKAVQFIADFEQAVAREAYRADVDGIVCGHIHHAEVRTINGVLYANAGDWVESCTALVEHLDGRLEIIQWAQVNHEPSNTSIPHPGGDGIPPPEDILALPLGRTKT